MAWLGLNSDQSTSNVGYTSSFDPSSSSAFAYLSRAVPFDDNYQLGDWITGRTAAKQQLHNQSLMDAKEFQRNEYSAQQQRAFEEYMDSTRVQRAMKDLQAAGLNPWLAVQSAGFGSSTPVGAAASSSAGQVASFGSGSPGAAIGATAFGLAKLIQVIAKVVK